MGMGTGGRISPSALKSVILWRVGGVGKRVCVPEPQDDCVGYFPTLVDTLILCECYFNESNEPRLGS